MSDKKIEVLESLEKNVQTLISQAHLLNKRHLRNVTEITRKLQNISLYRESQIAIPTNSWLTLEDRIETHFSELNIKEYRGFTNIVFEKLRSLNVIVGVNNSGKTSILEAIYLLSKMTDARSLIEIAKNRSRKTEQPSAIQMKNLLPHNILIKGKFNQKNIELFVMEMDALRHLEDGYYSHTLCMESSYYGLKQDSEIIIQHQRSPIFRFNGNRVLCRSVFSSPFIPYTEKPIERQYSESVQKGTLQKVIIFIQKNIDPKVTAINMVKDDDDETYFLVTHDDFPSPKDLRTFGQGLRRIFEIGLAFAASKNGVVLIDEFETAFHVEILGNLISFIENLASEMNVQVFVTTHSQETINAFRKNATEKSVCFYTIIRDKNENKVEVERYTAEKLKDIHDYFDFDIRRIK